MPAPTTERRDSDADSPRICWCMKVDEATLVRAIRSGVEDLEALREATRAGTGCGTCRSELIALLERERGAEPSCGRPEPEDRTP